MAWVGALGIHSTLAALTLIILSVEMLKISIFFFKKQNFLMENIESFEIFYYSKWSLQN
jgi:hypothetical protein